MKEMNETFNERYIDEIRPLCIVEISFIFGTE